MQTFYQSVFNYQGKATLKTRCLHCNKIHFSYCLKLNLIKLFFSVGSVRIIKILLFSKFQSSEIIVINFSKIRHLHKMYTFPYRLVDLLNCTI